MLWFKWFSGRLETKGITLFDFINWVPNSYADRNAYTSLLVGTYESLLQSVINAFNSRSFPTPVGFIGWMLSLVGSLVAVGGDGGGVTWVGIEVATVGLLGAMVKCPRTSDLNKFLYFFAQSVGSLSFVYGWLVIRADGGPHGVGQYSYGLVNWYTVGESFEIFGLVTKAGVGFMWFWTPIIFTQMCYSFKFAILTYLKLAPLLNLGDLFDYHRSYFLLGVLVVGGIIGVLGGVSRVNSHSLVIAYSGIGHSSWMLVSSVISKHLFLWYVLSYSLHVALWCCVAYQMGCDTASSSRGHMFIGVIIISLSGLPPLPGFALKTWVLFSVPHASSLAFVAFFDSVISYFYCKAFSHHIEVGFYSNYPSWYWISKFSFLLGLFLWLFIVIGTLAAWHIASSMPFV